MNTDGSDPRRVTETADPRSSDDPAWAPDGSRIVFGTNRDGPIQIWSVRPDGTDARVMPIRDAATPVSWQPLFVLCEDGMKDEACKPASSPRRRAVRPR